MNGQKLAFTVHDGDLKAGNGTPGSLTPTICSDALYVQALGFFNALHAPAMLTPGDNDWTDCDRPSNGSFKFARPPRPRASGLLLDAVLAGPEADAPGSAAGAPIPWGERPAPPR